MAFEKTVLVMVRSPTTLVRSADLARHLFSDPRIQVLFTISEPRSTFSNELELAINRMGLPFVPWNEAVLETYDLAIIESSLDPLPEIKAPVIMLSHGVGHNSVRSISGANTVHSNWLDEGPGTDYPRIVGLVSEDETRMFEGRCQTRVVGDPVFDSMLQARHRRDDFRKPFGAEGRKLVVFSSTWGKNSSFAKHPNVLSELLSSLPADEYAVAAILHPNIWMGHGPWQVKTWLRDALSGGLKLIPFDGGWQATLLAADCLVGDHGSVSTYASMLGIPTCLLSYPKQEMHGELSIVQAMGANEIVQSVSEIADFVKALDPQPCVNPHEQSGNAFSHVDDALGKVAELAYGLMGIEPSSSAVLPLRLEPPLPSAEKPSSFWVGFVREHDGTFSVKRTPASIGPSNIRSDATLLAASSGEANYRLLQSASCVMLEKPEADGWWRDASPFARCAYCQQDTTGWLTDRCGARTLFEVPEHADHATIGALLAHCLARGDLNGIYRVAETLFTVSDSKVTCKESR
ncbi:hypothetical protein C1878_03790 [Gordonibacter sp. 28C]|uniref:hypothetical protein n=1 Tax=Gordonibacter sp. 28C TaxID=2078569 RepID=UPI000DF756E8|nr:hypothetical protein [Gordonibacter sp. 28C]RDB63919.1 hypothetical protein C1878_03790 [Gordonibacter sp. 28C]